MQVREAAAHHELQLKAPGSAAGCASRGYRRLQRRPQGLAVQVAPHTLLGRAPQALGESAQGADTASHPSPGHTLSGSCRYLAPLYEMFANT